MAILKQETFETFDVGSMPGSFTGDGLWSGIQQKTSGRVSVIDSPTRTGTRAAAVTVLVGDNNVAGSGTGERTEFCCGATGLGDATPDGLQRWFATSIYLPDSYVPTEGTDWNLLWQLHVNGTGQINVGGNTCLNICMKNGAANSPPDPFIRNTLAFTVFGGTTAWQESGHFVLANPFLRNTWYDVVVGMRFASDNSGWVEIWVNGVNVVTRRNMPTRYVNTGLYLKQGNYRAGPGSGNSTHYVDRVLIGESKTDVEIAQPATGDTPTRRSYSTAALSSQATSITIAKPAGVETGDILVASVLGQYSTGSFTAPSGWTEHHDIGDSSGEAYRLGLFSKKITNADGEPASYTWTFALSQIALGGIVCVANGDSVDTTGTATGTATANQTTASITTAEDNSLVLAFHGSDFQATNSWSSAASATEIWDFEDAVGYNHSLAAYEYEKATAGSTSHTATESAAVAVAATNQIIAIKPTSTSTEPTSMGRIYAVEFEGQAVSAQVDFFEIQPADDKPCIIHALYLSQSSDVGDSAEEILRVQIIRGHTSSGSGGSSYTPRALNPDDAAAGFTAETLNTTIASAGTTNNLHSEAFNIRTGLAYIPTPETRPMAKQGNTTLVVRLMAAPADALTMSGTLIVEEV